MSRKPFGVAVAAIFLVVSMGSMAVHAQFAGNAPVKNVIIMIPDGMSMGGYTLARWFNGGKPLVMDELACGLVRTHSAGSAITDSAAAATAYATGFKTDNEMVGVMARAPDMPGLDPSVYNQKFSRMPVANLMEAARERGIATGLVVTCASAEATPAAFSSHFPDRNAFEVIVEQQVYCGLDLFLGAGDKCLMAEARKDKEDLIGEIKGQGYAYVTTPGQMRKAQGQKVWGNFGDNSIAYEIDRTDAQPSLADMTEKAIQLLSRSDRGFLLMVEGSMIDWAAHSNEPVGLISEILAFDQAVAKALEFAKANGETAIIIMTDHGNGGVAIGARGSTVGNHPDEFLACLKKAKRSGQSVAAMLSASMDDAAIRTLVAENYGVSGMTDGELARLRAALPGGNNKAIRVVLGDMMNRRSNLGWINDNHVADDAVLFMYLPGGGKAMGTVENSDIASMASDLLGLSLPDTGRKLFHDAVNEFPKAGAELSIVGMESGNPVLVAVKPNLRAEFPEAKNYAVVNGKKIGFVHGQNIRIGEKWYIPEEGIRLISTEGQQ
jgi:alkaline phosphatase